MIRDELKAALIAAMKGGDKPATQTIRMIQSSIKNRDIELRTGDTLAVDAAMQVGVGRSAEHRPVA